MATEVPQAMMGVPMTEEKSKDDGKSTRSSRCYAPLPFQLKRLFFCREPGDVKIAGRYLELVHKDPHVYTIEDFMSESEYEYFEQLIDQQYGKFRASYTDEGVDEQYHSVDRTSAFISLRKSGSRQVRSLEARASEIVGLLPENVEPLQMVGYRQNDKFDLHHDGGTYDEQSKTVESVVPRRLVTFFVYLNNLPRGQGHTVFPRIKLSVQPQRLKAILFCNVLESGEPDPRVVHRGDPVTDGGLLKFGVNVWITDKNLQALAFSSQGAVLDTHKPAPQRTILSMLDEPCEICGKRSEQEKMLLCDHCDFGYHMACLTPPLRHVPKKAWLCPNCVGKRPRRGHYCEACGGGEKEHRILLCDDCGRAYHTYCLDPPLSRVPKEDWFCQRCVNKQERKLREEATCGGCGGKDDPESILLCDNKGCMNEWHLRCLKPPLKSVPRGKWHCPTCVAQIQVEAEEAALKASKVEETPPKPQPLVPVTQGPQPKSYVYVALAQEGQADRVALALVEEVLQEGSVLKLRMMEQQGVRSRAGLKYRATAELREESLHRAFCSVAAAAITDVGQAGLLVHVTPEDIQASRMAS